MSGRLEAAHVSNSVATVICCKMSLCAQICDDKTDVVSIKQAICIEQTEKKVKTFSQRFHLLIWLI